MRIEAVETFLFHHWLVVRIDTDTGITGYGPSAYWGYPDAAERIVSAFRQQLLGTDPLRIEQHWNRLFHWKPFRDGAITGAVAAVDIALWDIAGRHFGVPAYQLLGGKQRDKARLHLLIDSPDIDTLVAEATSAVDAGFTAVKFDALPDGAVEATETYTSAMQTIVERVAAAREAVGWEIDLILELHRDFNPGEVIALAGELERFRLYFIEDPIPPHSADAHTDVLRHSRVPVAVGERATCKTPWIRAGCRRLSVAVRMNHTVRCEAGGQMLRQSVCGPHLGWNSETMRPPAGCTDTPVRCLAASRARIRHPAAIRGQTRSVQFSMRSNWSTVSATIPNIRWHSTLA